MDLDVAHAVTVLGKGGNRTSVIGQNKGSVWLKIKCYLIQDLGQQEITQLQYHKLFAIQ